MSKFVVVGNNAYPVADITSIGLREVEILYVKLDWRDGAISELHGMDALRIVMQLCPEALEGKRLRWIRHAWAIHNLIGHPLMQVFAFLGCHTLAMRTHEITIPKPRGAKV